jgi:hypothetical protein
MSITLSDFCKENQWMCFNQSETRFACGGHVCDRIEPKGTIFIGDLPYMLPTKLWFIWPSCFKGDDTHVHPTEPLVCVLPLTLPVIDLYQVIYAVTN